MSDVVITSDTLIGSDDAIETVKLNFTAVEMIYSIRNPDGSQGGMVQMSFDIETGE